MYQPQNNTEKRTILARTHGRCHLCEKTVYINNYGKIGRRGAWEVDHSRAQAVGGTDHGNNLFAACIRCNRSKGAGNSGAYRRSKGIATKPTSTAQRKCNRMWNTVLGGATGALCGLRFGPIGAICGGVAGAAVGNDLDPD